VAAHRREAKHNAHGRDRRRVRRHHRRHGAA
jgi:hypothetical protein